MAINPTASTNRPKKRIWVKCQYFPPEFPYRGLILVCLKLPIPYISTLFSLAMEQHGSSLTQRMDELANIKMVTNRVTRSVSQRTYGDLLTYRLLLDFFSASRSCRLSEEESSDCRHTGDQH
jgi:hypothetical protein